MGSVRADDVQHLKDVAAEWILKQHSGEWAEADAVELQRWLEAATTHRIAYLRAQATWNEASRLKVLGAGLAPGVVPSADDFNDSAFFKQRPGHSDLPVRRIPAWTKEVAGALAASALLLVGGYFTLNNRTVPVAQYSTAVGVLSAIPLSDGSKITLNTDSEIQLQMTGKERSAKLGHGEAYFEVAKDPQRPFVVTAGQRRVVVLGTKFSVRRINEELQVVVTEGRVRIGDSQVGAGGVARVTGTRIAIEQRPLSEVEELLSWRSGFVVFHETPLADAVAEFNRYNKRKVVIHDAGVAALKVSGNFKVAYLDSFIGLLEDGFPVSVERQDARIVLTSRQRE